MVKSYLNLLVRNRKVHFLVFVVALLTVVNQTLRGRGITINYTTDDPHSKELTYESISDNIKKGFFVTDMRIQRCLRGFSCSAPPNEQPGFWVKIPTKLNLYPHSFSMYNYYMYIEKTRGNESKRFVEDIQFSSKNEQPEKGKTSNAKWLSHKVASRSYIWIKYVENIDFAVRMVRDVNVLYGKHDMIDARKHWKFSPSPIQLPLKQLIQPKLSMLMVAVNDEMAIFNADQQFENVQKKNEIILTVDPNFKVLQISDMHIGQDSALCDGDQCKFDVKTLKFIENVIANEENVKFIFFTGDLIDFTRVKHFESAVLKALAPVLRAEIPFVFTFGDSEHEWSNPQTKINILNFISSLPGCYNKRPSQLDRRLHGLTNGNINVYRVPPAGGFEEFDYNKLKLEEPSAVLTYLDSEEMYVDETQSNYLYRILKRLANVDLKLLFFHNPLPNFRPQGKFKLIGSYNEKHQIETKSSRQFLKDVKECGYRAVCVGHEHENDSCIWDDKDDKEILLCYSSVAGESADTRLDKNFGRRLRVFDINFDKVEILSWKRLKGDKEQSEMIDPQLVWKAADPEPEFAKQDDQDNGEAPAKEAPMDKPVDKPAENKPAAEEPAKEPAAEKPAAEKPAAEKPAAEKPAAEKPAAEKPAAEKPAAEKPAAEKPAAKKPAAEEAAEEPVAKNPAEEKPAAKQEAAAPAEDAAPAEAAAAPAKEAAAAPAEDAAAAPAEEAPAGDAEAAAPVEKLEEEPAAEEPAVDAAAEPAVALEEAAP